MKDHKSIGEVIAKESVREFVERMVTVRQATDTSWIMCFDKRKLGIISEESREQMVCRLEVWRDSCCQLMAEYFQEQVADLFGRLLSANEERDKFRSVVVEIGKHLNGGTFENVDDCPLERLKESVSMAIGEAVFKATGGLNGNGAKIEAEIKELVGNLDAIKVEISVAELCAMRIRVKELEKAVRKKGDYLDGAFGPECFGGDEYAPIGQDGDS
jgi:hypothetical protein